MLFLRSSPSSPFGRKIKIALSLLGLKDRVKVENADTADPADSLRGQNPLGKIPALVLEDGDVLYDSNVILEYLDHLAGGGKIIPQDASRFGVLRDAALANGLMEAAVLQVYEKRFRKPDERSQGWLDYQAAKVERALAHAEVNCPETATSPDDVDIAALSLACALGYLDIRYAGSWRGDHPKLAAWLDAFEAAVPAFADTKLPAAPVPENDPVPLR